MPPPKPIELKKSLVAKGFEIYRSTADEVVLAERVRDNLLMDGAVCVRASDPLRIRIGFRAQSAEFPGESAERLTERALRAANAAAGHGYRHAESKVIPIRDPGDPARTLDTWYEVWFEKVVEDANELEAELRRALAFEKAARP